MEKLEKILNIYRPAIRELVLSNPGFKDPDPRDPVALKDAIQAIETLLNEKRLAAEEVVTADDVLRIYKQLLTNLENQNRQ